MKVLLLKDIRGLGRKNDIKEVSDGYAANYLLPRKLATAATRTIAEKINLERAETEKRDAELTEKLKKDAAAVKNLLLEFNLKTGENSSVFGSVAAPQIETALSERGFSGVKVVLNKPLKTLGEQTVELDFGKGIRGKIAVRIRGSGF